MVSTQEPDLTWMKSPRFAFVFVDSLVVPARLTQLCLLTELSLCNNDNVTYRLAQLLEERPKPPEGRKYPLSEKQPVMSQSEAAQSTGSPPSTTSTWTNLREISGENPRDLEPMSEPCSVHVEGSAIASSLHLSPGGGGLVGRKRSSSLRDSMEEDSETVTVLQEADSTVDIEQPPVEEKLEEISPKKVRDSSNNSDASPLKSLLEKRALPTPGDTLTGSGHIEGAHSENNAANANNEQTGKDFGMTK